MADFTFILLLREGGDLLRWRLFVEDEWKVDWDVGCLPPVLGSLV